MKAPTDERELYHLLEVLRREVVLREIKETLKSLEKQTGILLRECNLDYSDLKYREISTFLYELGLLLPNWKKEILEKIEIWL